MDAQKTPTRVLIIDDDEVSRQILSLLLQREQYLVETAESGEAALLQLPGTSPHVVLADLQMPGLTGAALARTLHERCSPATVLLAMSGSQPSEDILQQGYHSFLLKPFTMQAFAEAILSHTNYKEAKLVYQDETILDQAVFENLSASMKGTQLEQLYGMCLKDSKKRIQRMWDASKTGDEASYRREAHAVKGSSGMVGALELQKLATTMEINGLDANHVATLDEILLACEHLKRMLIARHVAIQ